MNMKMKMVTANRLSTLLAISLLTKTLNRHGQGKKTARRSIIMDIKKIEAFALTIKSWGIPHSSESYNLNFHGMEVYFYRHIGLEHVSVLIAAGQFCPKICPVGWRADTVYNEIADLNEFQGWQTSF